MLRLVMSEPGAERIAWHYVAQEKKAVAWGKAGSSLLSWKFWYPDNICPTKFSEDKSNG